MSFKDGLGRAADTLGALTKRLIVQVAASAKLFPAFVRKPGAVLVLFTRSHRAQLILLAALILAPTIIPSGSDWLLAKLYRPVKGSILGIIDTTHKNPKIRVRQRQMRYVIWYGAGATVLLAFWCSIPAAVRRSNSMAALKKGKADAIAGDNPEASAQLYRSAHRYAVDAALAHATLEQLVAVGGEGSAVSDMSDTPAASSAGEGTVLVAPDAAGAAQPNFSERYKTIRELGRGSMGLVFLARDVTLERDVAVKRLPAMVADAELRARLKKEALALARLNHPGIVQVYDFVDTGEVSWLVMEYIPGEDLEEVLEREGPLPLDRATAIALAAAEAISYAHDEGVLHRDLKPANLMVSRSGKVKVTDFGVARLAQSSATSEATQLGTVLGSPSYMSPEQARGEQSDERSDIYSFGATLYKVLTGAPPFTGTLAEVVSRVLTDEPKPLSEVLEAGGDELGQLSALVASMLDKDCRARPQNMAEVAKSLREISRMS
jgi:predicted Ser/Thr protein kinase